MALVIIASPPPCFALRHHRLDPLRGSVEITDPSHAQDVVRGMMAREVPL